MPDLYPSDSLRYAPSALATSVEAPAAPPALVLLGASNLSLAFPAAVAAARRHCGPAVEMFVAKGFGRSYGLTTTVLGRTLPAIRNSGVLGSLGGAPAGRRYAVVADIGNDLLYDVPVPTITDWVAESFDRLLEAGARVAALSLPIGNFESISPRRYRVLRTALYPSCRLGFCELRRRAERLDDAIRAASADRGIELVEQRRQWYGIDPIHIRRRAFRTAWNALLGAVAGRSLPAGNGRIALPGWSLHRLRPARIGYFGRQVYTPQPALRVADGTAIHLF